MPFKKPDGTISQYARQLCPDCGGYDHERDYADANMPDRQPGDFDFPFSETWRGNYNGDQQIETGKQAFTPSSAPPENLDDRRWASVQQLRAEVWFLRKKVTDVRVEKEETPKKYEKYT